MINYSNPNAGQTAVMDSMEQSTVPAPAVNGFDVLRAKVNDKVLHDAEVTLQNYKEGKANLERNVIDNQQWYKLRQWEVLRRKQRSGTNTQVEPTSAWLFNAIANKAAVAMDNFPRASIQPREQGDEMEAKMLESVIPVIMDQCEFEETYRDVIFDTLISGTGIFGVFWDASKLNGLGDIAIHPVDVLNLFWEPGIQKIEQSRNVFYVTTVDNEILEEQYPQFANRLGGMAMNISEYVYDDTVDTSHKSIVIDWYYKRNQNGKTVLHYCKWIMGQPNPLFATENDPQFAERGWYDDGEYPFVFNTFYKVKGTPCGFSYIDIGKGPQEYIDRGERAIQQNLQFNAKPRHFIRSDGAVNEEEYADSERDLVHVDGNLGQDSVLPITVNPLNAIYVQIIQNKIDELKETTGNRDVSTGGTTGATAASAIAAQQEAGAKLDRDNGKASYRAFRKVILKVIERCRQFYDQGRYFRIMGDNGVQQFVNFSNQGLVPQYQGNDFGIDMGYRVPYFDVKPGAEKENPYTRADQNQLALSFYSAGFFYPQNAIASLMCLDMMDFDGKDKVMNKIAVYGTIESQKADAQNDAIMMAQQLDAQDGGNRAEILAQKYQSMMGGTPGNAAAGQAMGAQQPQLGGSKDKGQKLTDNAKKRTAQASEPR